MKQLIISAFLLTIVPSGAFAQTGIFVGNGGQVVECRDSNGAVNSRFAFDLYEGSALFGYTYPSRVDAEAFALELARKVDVAQDWSTKETLTIEQRVRYMIEKKVLLPTGVGLKPTEDTQEFISLPTNCALQQTVNFRNSNKIYVNSDVWNTLSPVNQAALYLHEAIYWYLREPGLESDSRRTRKAVAYLVAGGALTPPTQMPAGLKLFQYCHSTNRDSTGDWQTRFYAYRNSARQPVLQFLQVAGYKTLALTTLDGQIHGGVAELPIRLDRLGLNNISGQLKSALDIDAMIKVAWGDGKARISGVMQPGSRVSSDIICERAHAK